MSVEITKRALPAGLLQIVVTSAEMALTVTLPTDLEIGGDLNEAYKAHAGVYAQAAALHAEARAWLGEVEHACDRVEGLIHETLRAQCNEEKLAATITPKTIQARMAYHPEVSAARVAVLRARRATDTVEAICKAYGHRRDMLVSLGAQSRHDEAVQESLRMLGRRMRAQIDSNET